MNDWRGVYQFTGSPRAVQRLSRIWSTLVEHQVESGRSASQPRRASPTQAKSNRPTMSATARRTARSKSSLPIIDEPSCPAPCSLEPITRNGCAVETPISPSESGLAEPWSYSAGAAHPHRAKCPHDDQDRSRAVCWSSSVVLRSLSWLQAGTRASGRTGEPVAPTSCNGVQTRVKRRAP